MKDAFLGQCMWHANRDEMLAYCRSAEFEPISPLMLDKYFTKSLERQSEAYGVQNNDTIKKSGSRLSYISFSRFELSSAANGYFDINRLELNYDRVLGFVNDRLFGQDRVKFDEILSKEESNLNLIRAALMHQVTINMTESQQKSIFLLYMKGFLKDLYEKLDSRRYTISSISDMIQSTVLNDDGNEVNIKGTVGDAILSWEIEPNLENVLLIIELKRLCDQLLKKVNRAKSEVICQMHTFGKNFEIENRIVKGLLSDMMAIYSLWRFPCDQSPSGGSFFITKRVVSSREYLLTLLLSLCENVTQSDLQDMSTRTKTIHVRRLNPNDENDDWSDAEDDNIEDGSSGGFRKFNDDRKDAVVTRATNTSKTNKNCGGTQTGVTKRALATTHNVDNCFEYGEDKHEKEIDEMLTTRRFDAHRNGLTYLSKAALNKRKISLNEIIFEKWNDKEKRQDKGTADSIDIENIPPSRIEKNIGLGKLWLSELL